MKSRPAIPGVTAFCFRSHAGRFDFVPANQPFNVNAVDKEWVKDSVGAGRRFPFGLPRTENVVHKTSSAVYKHLLIYFHAPSPINN